MAVKLLVLDNYDSFTYNLVHLLKEIGGLEIEVHRNDKISLDQVNVFDEIVLSPGPGIPQEAGIMPELVSRFGASKKILGICLGHQCIGEVYGGKLINLARPVHGVATNCKVLVDDEPLFRDLTHEFHIGRYHSWIVSKEQFPECLTITAEDHQGQIMALRHREYRIVGLQFHPESVLTPEGGQIIRNWLKDE